MIKESDYPFYNDTVTVKKAITNLSSLSKENPDSIHQEFKRVLNASIYLGYADGTKESTLRLLIYYDQIGDWQKRQNLLQTLSVACTYNPRLYVVFPFIDNAIAKGYQMQDEFDSASVYYLKAITLAKKYQPEYLATLYNNYGSLLDNYGQVKDSIILFYLSEAEKMAIQNSDTNIQIATAINKANHYRNENRLNESQQAAHSALILATIYNDLQWQTASLNSLAQNAYLQNKYDSAIFFSKKALSLSSEPQSAFYANIAYVLLGRIYLVKGEYTQSFEYIQKALIIAQQYNIYRDVIETNRLLSEWYAANKNWEKAYEHERVFSRLSDSVRNAEVLKNLSRQEIKYRAAEKDKEILQRQIAVEDGNLKLKRRNRIIILISLGALLLSAIFANIYMRIRQKQKILTRDNKIKEMNAVIKGEEMERSRIAGELHDGIGGMLAAIKMNLDVARKKDFANHYEMLQIINMIDTTADEVRKASHGLKPPALMNKDISEAIQYFCNYIIDTSNLHLDLSIGEDVNSIPEHYSNVLYRIVQELIQNIIKHSKANQAVISMDLIKGTLVLTAEDNGIGFDTRQVEYGLGLKNIEARVKSLNGKMDMESQENVGTTSTIIFKIDPSIEFFDVQER